MKHTELAHYMLALKLSQSDLARLLPMSISAVARMSRGVAPVNPVVARVVRYWVVVPGSLEMWRRYLAMVVK